VTGPGLIWDACGLLNLLATDRVDEIVHHLGVPCSVLDEVLAQEVLFLRKRPDDQNAPSLEEIDPGFLFERALFIPLVPTAPERERFTDLALTLDDGEALTLAVAEARGLAVATDDRAALRHLRESCGQAVTTPEWIHAWAVATGPSSDVLRSILDSVYVRASYVPPRGHPLRGWWLNSMR
jgi:hypothetical protein